MTVIATNKHFQKIAEHLGIKNCKSIQITAKVDEVAIVKAEFYPEVEGVKQITPIFSEFELVKKMVK